MFIFNFGLSILQENIYTELKALNPRIPATLLIKELCFKGTVMGFNFETMS